MVSEHNSNKFQSVILISCQTEMNGSQWPPGIVRKITINAENCKNRRAKSEVIKELDKYGLFFNFFLSLRRFWLIQFN